MNCRSVGRITVAALFIVLLSGCTLPVSVSSNISSTTPTTLSSSKPASPTTLGPSPSGGQVPDSTPSPSSSILLSQGQWQGTWDSSAVDAHGTFDLDVTIPIEGTVSGTIKIHNSVCITSAIVTGNISGSAITFGVVAGRDTITFTGQINALHKSMHGTYVTGTSCGNDNGTWTATRH